MQTEAGPERKPIRKVLFSLQTDAGPETDKSKTEAVIGQASPKHSCARPLCSESAVSMVATVAVKNKVSKTKSDFLEQSVLFE